MGQKKNEAFAEAWKGELQCRETVWPHTGAVGERFGVLSQRRRKKTRVGRDERHVRRRRRSACDKHPSATSRGACIRADCGEGLDWTRVIRGGVFCVRESVWVFAWPDVRV